MRPLDLPRRAVAEGLGTALLLATVIGSGILAERLAAGNAALALLANAIATGTGLVALILAFGSLSGAHFNPAVTLAQAARGAMRWNEVPSYVLAQLAGAYIGVVIAHVMFEAPIFSLSQHARIGAGQWVAEFVATFGLLLVIWGTSERQAPLLPFAVAAYITSAYWFTSSTSFANPAVTLARVASDTFAGIRPADAPAFVVAQLAGAGTVTMLAGWLMPVPPRSTDDSLVRSRGTRAR
jgi:glycerol uptake facilitator-like aquaporin